MKNKPILIALVVFFIASTKALAQDAFFSQWESMPIYFNPALTGNFDGLYRFRAKYRNQWRSLLKENSYKTKAVAAEYKFTSGDARNIGVGLLWIQDKAGSLDFTNQSINISSSVIQHLGNPDHQHHSIGVGLNAGLANRKIDLVNAQWPGGTAPTDIIEKTNFADVSTGLLWQYESNTHFSFHLGSAWHHINRPNVSLSKTGHEKLYQRFNLHGTIEIPLIHTFSMVPSFLFDSQGPSEQLLFGLNNRWYPKSLNPNFVQLGFFAKTTTGYNGTNITIYVLSATVEINSFMAGFSFDRFQEVESNAYEFSVGYTFGMHGAKGTASNTGYTQPSIRQ